VSTSRGDFERIDTRPRGGGGGIGLFKNFLKKLGRKTSGTDDPALCRIFRSLSGPDDPAGGKNLAGDLKFT